MSVEKTQIPQGYKQTEVGVIPEDWEVSCISELTSIVGDGIHSTPLYSCNGDHFFINGNNLVNGSISITEATKSVCHAEFLKHKKNLNDRTIFISINGTIGNLAYYNNEPVILGKSAAYLNVKDSCSKVFLYYILQTETVKQCFKDGLTGTTIRNLGLGTIRNTLIPLPVTKGEQTAIANALSDTDALIQSLTRLIAKKRQIKQGAMQTLLNPYENNGKLKIDSGECSQLIPIHSQLKKGWVVMKLEEVAHIEMGQSPSSNNYNKKGNGLPLVQGNADIKNRKTIIRIYTSEITKKCISGNIIMSVRAPVGEIAVASFDACIGRGVCAIKYPNEYLFHYLVSIESSWGKLSKGSTFDSVNSTEVKGLDIYMPEEFAEQTRIATILSDMDTDIAALETKLTKTQHIKQGMMQNLLTGRLRLVENGKLKVESAE